MIIHIHQSLLNSQSRIMYICIHSIYNVYHRIQHMWQNIRVYTELINICSIWNKSYICIQLFLMNLHMCARLALCSAAYILYNVRLLGNDKRVANISPTLSDCMRENLFWLCSVILFSGMLIKTYSASYSTEAVQ